MTRRLLLPALCSLVAYASLAVPAGAAAPSACPGDPIDVDRAITGEFDGSLQGSYVLVPFDVPAGTTSVRVKYCYDTPESGTLKHTLDLGMYQPRPSTATTWGETEFRGWGGSSHPDVTITPQGFSTEEQYKANPRGHVPGRTTRGFRPGSIPAGQWAAELGVAAVVSQADGDADGKVAWRIEIENSSDPAFAAEPYQPAAYDERPQKGAGWYQGDLHVHSEHSSLGDAPMSEVFGYAFGTAGLDFITLTDYVTDTAWNEIGRYQGAHRGRLIARSSEVITYRGHLMNQTSASYVDYRTGRVFEREESADLRPVREPTPPSVLFRSIRDGGGWTQVNHPTIFPSETPGFANLCRGCPWDYSDAETNWRRVDAFEVNTGPAQIGTIPNGFTTTAIAEWDALRKRGYPLTGVSVSDSHDAGEPDGPTESPIGNGRTVVFADELSEHGVRRAVQAGHAYVKNFRDSPELRLEARAGGRVAIMGDALRQRRAAITARVTGATGEGWRLIVLRDGRRISDRPITSSRFTFGFTARRAGEYRIQVERTSEQGAVVHSISNPIALGKTPRRAPRGLRAGGTQARLRLSASRPRRRGTAVRVTFTARTTAGAPLGGVLVRWGGRSDYTDSRGRATMTARILEPGRYRARAVALNWIAAARTVAVR